MTTLVSEELIDTLTQTINFKYYKHYHIEAVKIKLAFVGSPSGTFTLSAKQGATTLASQNFDFSDIQSDLSSVDANGYIYKVLEFGSSLKLKAGSYDFVLSSSGYTYSAGSYLAWVKSYENIFNEREGEFDSIKENPLDILIYERRREDLR